ncbi:MAG: hypothetical protein IKQ23_08975 [Treponema sp.]|nr:hypothetical protein [Treponema sp.]
MLCAKYDYKMDIAVKQEEAFEDGMEKKAVEAAITLVRQFNIAPEDAAVNMGAPLNKVLEALSEDGSEVSSLYDKYGYKLETSIKQEEAFEDGMEKGLKQGIEQGIEQGMEQKAVEAAITLVREFGISVEEAAEKMGAPLDKVLEKMNTKAPGKASNKLS